MLTLGSLNNTSRPKENNKRVGRGLGSGKGKTCGRGEKGAGSRSGYTRRLGYEGGQFRTFMKFPIRGFSNVRFRKTYETINLGQINEIFVDGETVNIRSLKEKGFVSGRSKFLKILGDGELTKKVTIEADAATEGARTKLQEAKIHCKIANLG